VLKEIPKKPYRAERTRDCVARLLCPKRDTIPPSIATYERIDELSKPTPTELDCALCGGVGLPKIDGTNRPVCVVCRDTLKEIPRANRKALIADHEAYMWYRLPHFEQYMVLGRFEAADTQLNRIA